MAFIQARGGKVTNKEREVLSAVVQGLGQIVEASFVTQRQKDRIAALMQSNADAEEDAELGAHTNAVDAIMETLGEMEDKAEDSLTEARKSEAESQQSHALLKQGLENEIANSKKAKSQSTQLSASTASKLADAEKDLAVEKKGLKEDTAYLSDLKRDCQTRASEFEVESKDNKAELTALGKAKAILLKKFAASLVQTGAKVAAQARVADSDADAQEDAKARALRSIEGLGKRLHSTALLALAYRAAEDPFGKIRGMVEEMIAKLMQEAAEEATQKAFCDKEIGESEASQGSKSQKLDELSSRMDRLSASQAQLTEEIAKLMSELNESDKAMAAATEVS